MQYMENYLQNNVKYKNNSQKYIFSVDTTV